MTTPPVTWRGGAAFVTTICPKPALWRAADGLPSIHPLTLHRLAFVRVDAGRGGFALVAVRWNCCASGDMPHRGCKTLARLKTYSRRIAVRSVTGGSRRGRAVLRTARSAARFAWLHLLRSLRGTGGLSLGYPAVAACCTTRAMPPCFLPSYLEGAGSRCLHLGWIAGGGQRIPRRYRMPFYERHWNRQSAAA